MDTEGQDLPDGAVLRVPACDNCKNRKIKCDRNTPCSSCKASNITCRTTKRAPEKRQRVLLSKHYGDEIASVNRRLSDLSSTINTLVESRQRTNDSPSAQAVTLNALAVAPRPDAQEPNLAEDGPYEGDTSFASHSKTITQALGAALGGSSSYTSSSSPASNAAVQKLLDEVAVPSHSSAISSPSIHSSMEMTQQHLPPVTPVLKLLKLSTDTPQKFFMDYSLITIQEFKDVCQNVYFPTREYALVSWIEVNFGLFFLFRDLDKPALSLVGISRNEARAYSELCHINILNSINGLKLLMEATLDNVTVLALAALIATECGKASLAWRVTSAAARLCLDLGLHRQATNADGRQASRERMMFWMVYAIDKGLALNFGRTSNIHDYDVTTPRPNGSDFAFATLNFYYNAWIDWAELQGAIYEQLFSAAAQKQPDTIRIPRARAMADQLLHFESQISQNLIVDGPMAAAMQEFMLSSVVVVSCLLTLVYRVLPSPPGAHPLDFAEECVEAARTALRRLGDSWKQIQPRDDEAWRGFINWTLLYVPFIPFIVVFGHTIAHRSREDLMLLDTAVSTLRSASQVAPTINKLRDACEKFCQIGTAYLAQEEAVAPQFNNSKPVSSSDVLPDGPLAYPTQMDFQAMSDFPMQQGEWDGMLNEWDLGLGAENAREMTAWFETYMSAQQPPGTGIL